MKASTLYKHCYSVMTKGPHLNAGCFPMFSTVNKIFALIWTLLHLQGKRTMHVTRCWHTSHQYVHWGSLDESNSFSMCYSLFLVWQCAGRVLFVCGLQTAVRRGRAGLQDIAVTYTCTLAVRRLSHIHRAVQDVTGDPSFDITIVKRLLQISCSQIQTEEIL